MSKVTKVADHLTINEIERKIKQTVGFRKVQKWLIIYNSIQYLRKAEEIAMYLAVSKSFVSKTISDYKKKGTSSIETIGKGGRKNSYMTNENERKFVTSFIIRAENGEVITTREIKENFEKAIGKKVHKTSIYRLLKRNYFCYKKSL
jgi:transposase